MKQYRFNFQALLELLTSYSKFPNCVILADALNRLENKEGYYILDSTIDNAMDCIIKMQQTKISSQSEIDETSPSEEKDRIEISYKSIGEQIKQEFKTRGYLISL